MPVPQPVACLKAIGEPAPARRPHLQLLPRLSSQRTGLQTRSDLGSCPQGKRRPGSTGKEVSVGTAAFLVFLNTWLYLLFCWVFLQCNSLLVQLRRISVYIAGPCTQVYK